MSDPSCCAASPRPSSPLARLAVVALLALGAMRCDGCACGGSSADLPPTLTPAERLERYAAHLPADTDLAVFFTDMDPARESLKHLQPALGGNLPLEVWRQDIQQAFGVDVLDKATYDKAGLDPQNGVAVASWRNAPLILGYVTDRARFEQQVVGGLARLYRAEGLPVADTAATPAVQTLRGRDGTEVSWVWLDDGMVMAAGAPLLPPTGDAPATSAAVLRAALSGARESNLDARPAFATFRQEAAAGYPAAIWLDSSRALQLYGQQDEALKKYQREVLGAFAENITWLGIGLKADPQAIQARLFFGVKPETLTAFQGLDKPDKPSPKLRLMVHERAYLVARTSVHAGIFWREYQKLLPETQQKFIAKIFSNIKSTTQIDIENDLIQNATGQAALVVYGLDPARLSERRANDRMKAASAVLHLQLREPARFVALLDRLVEELHGALRRVPLTGGVVAYGFDPNSSTAPPFRLFVRDDLVTVASTTLDEALVLRMLTGEVPHLAQKLDGTGGAALLDDAGGTGVWLNVDRIRQKVGAVLGGGLVEALLGPLDHASLRLQLHPAGLLGELELRLKPAGAAPADAAPDLGASPAPEAPASAPITAPPEAPAPEAP